MPCTEHYDKQDRQHCWVVNGDGNHAQLELWWNRSKHIWDGASLHEALTIRQQNAETMDVLVLPLGMVYDLIGALNLAVEKA